MSSIIYNGHDFGDYVSAELVEPVAHVVAPESAKVPGRPGRVLLSADVEPLELRVRLFLDAPDALTSAQRSELRRTLRSWLLNTAGSVLEVPGEPALEWHDVICAGVSDWSSLFSEGSATVTFLALDPIAYGPERNSTAATLEVGGTWPTWPVVEMVAVAGEDLQVGLGGSFVRMGRAFKAGDKVAIDMAAQTVTVGGQDATGDVALASDFFALPPGRVELLFVNCSSHVVRWRERWV